MILLASFDVVFQEIPGEVTLALNLSLCPHKCPGCHSPHLQEAVGESLTEELLKSLLDRYAASVSCVAFMGGDNSPAEVNALMAFVRRHYDIKIAWYSGRSEIAPEIEIKNLDFVKLGPYIEKFGGLDNPQTNQRFYEIDRSAKFIDKTELFRINQKNILPL